MKYILYGLLFFFLSVIISCKKYLDEKSDKSLVTPSTIKDLQGILDDNYIMNLHTPGFGETSSDDYFISDEDYYSLGDIDRNAYIWQLTNYTYGNDWNAAYSAIYNSNYCLESIEKIKPSIEEEPQWNNVKGSAYFFRAYYFLDLVWEYGKAYDDQSSASDPGIVLRLGSDFNVKSVRATVKESYEQVISDLKNAIPLLPEHPSHVMRPSKAAAYGLLARAFLTMRKYDSAYRYSDLCLNIKDDLLDYNSSEVNTVGNVPFTPFNREIIFYSTQTGNYTPKAQPYALIDTVLYGSYGSNDLRKLVFFFPNNGFFSFKGHYSGSGNTFFSGLATDEIVLIRAECNARKGNITDAMSDLNKLLVNRWAAGTFVPLTASTVQDALSVILTERRKELTQRGLRWIDIKRLNKEGALITPTRVVATQTYRLAPNSDKYALALPADIINVTGIAQN
jgi:hypothetical protein